MVFSSTQKWLFSFIAFAFFLFPSASFAEDTGKIEIISEKETVEVGESVRISISIAQGSTSGGVNTIAVDVKGLEPFEIRGNSSSNQISMINGVTTMMSRIERTLIPKKTGTFEIGPARYTLPSGETIESNILSIEVKEKAPIVQNDTHASANDPIFTTSVGTGNTLTWMLLLFLFALGGFFFWKSHHLQVAHASHKKSDVTPPIFPEITDEHFYEKIAQMIREYLEKKEGIPAREKTSTEIAELLSQKHTLHAEVISDILFQCDLSRFAKKEGNREEILDQVKMLLS